MERAQRTRRIATGCLALVLAACGGGGNGAVGHGVLLIAVDGLRADHIGSAGYDRDTAPHLDALARHGVAFDAALASSPLWFQSTASLLSGCDPNMARRGLPGLSQGPLDQAWFLNQSLPSIAVEFSVAGFRTAAFVDTPEFDEHTGLTRGFQDVRRVDDAWDRRVIGPLDQAAEWLAARSVDEDWFCLVQLHDILRAFDEPNAYWDGFFEPRQSLQWTPPVSAAERSFFALPLGRWEGGTLSMGAYEARYDGAVRRVDEAIQKLFVRLELGGRFKRTTVCVVGTHGLQFGEAGLLLDHGLCSPPDVRVPFVLRPAKDLSRTAVEGVRYREVCSLADVMPTLLDLAGVPVPDSVHGHSLADWVEHGPPDGAAERVVMVSCGILLGAAAYGDELVVDDVYPAIGTPPRLLDQWLGRPPLEARERRVYAWREARSDILLAGPTGPPGSEAETMRLDAVFSSWFEGFVIPQHQKFWGAP